MDFLWAGSLYAILEYVGLAPFWSALTCRRKVWLCYVAVSCAELREVIERFSIYIFMRPLLKRIYIHSYNYII